jgi:hypothetical protein
MIDAASWITGRGDCNHRKSPGISRRCFVPALSVPRLDGVRALYFWKPGAIATIAPDFQFVLLKSVSEIAL